MPKAIIISGILILIFTLIIMLQIRLSKKDNKYLGLIMPGINFLFSIIAVLGMISYVGEFNGEVISSSIITMVSYNIFTLILLGIYFKYKGSRKVCK